jgi:nitroimidazol reductase NimA-like FMN-containing flavoprotein (pyridoxamine 5'-phosphate oxidase superfamily)
MSELIDRARALLRTIEHATVATVCADGRPWNTPVFFAYDHGAIYWSSRTDSQHSENIRANGRAFLVIYDSSRPDATAAALYAEADAVELIEEKAIQAAVTMIYGRRKMPLPSLNEFAAPSVHRVYRATPSRAWLNALHADAEIPWDERIEVRLDS